MILHRSGGAVGVGVGGVGVVCGGCGEDIININRDIHRIRHFRKVIKHPRLIGFIIIRCYYKKRIRPHVLIFQTLFFCYKSIVGSASNYYRNIAFSRFYRHFYDLIFLLQ